MASRHVTFPEQIKESRKKIQDSFKRLHEALQVRENVLLSRVDEIEKEFNSKTEKMNKLVKSLNKVNSLCADTLTDNELKDTHDEVIASINRKVLELTDDTYTSIEFEWDNLFEISIEQLGSIKLNSESMIYPTSIFPPHVKPVVPDGLGNLISMEGSRPCIFPQRMSFDSTNNLKSMSNSTHPHSNLGHTFNKERTNVTTHMEHGIKTGISDSIRKQEQLEHKPTRGLKNLGNTCFMNCILQCLSHTLPLRDFFVSDEYKKHLKTKGDLSDTFKGVMSELWKSSNTVDSYAPHDLKKRVEIVAPRFSDYNQHDPQEFMRFLLNELHEEINKADVKGPKSPGDNESLQEACDRYLTWENSLISELFSGMLRSEVCCSVCEHRSVVFIPFMGLALPIPKSRSTSSRSYGYYPTSYDTVKLDACMQVFTEEEILDEEERPYCNKCNNLTKSTKQLSISKLPEFLVIQLKRFSGDSVRSKLSTLVKFEERWEICDNSGKTHAYSLYGIACHSGSIYGGHYTAYCKYNRQWRCFNNKYVAAENWDNVKCQEAYILFYEKINNN